MDIPDIGFGTFRMTDRDECVTAVQTALDVGFRHLDTAQMYENEGFVGDALADHDVPRNDVFVATKLDTSNLSVDDVDETARESANRLGLDTIDLLYVHWPIDTYDPDDTLPALADLVDDGVIDKIGLSNFTPDLLAEALDGLDDLGAECYAHQVECHPLLQQDELRRLAREHDHRLVAYSPIAKGAVTDVPELVEVAEKHDATPAQVSLAWLMDLEHVVPIPKSATPTHIRENYAARDLELDADDHDRIASIDREERQVDGDWTPW